jgi:hypothetical protein
MPRGMVELSVSKETAEMVKSNPKANKFEIKTPVAVAGVRGTNFIVYHDRGITGVYVKTGAVETYNPKIPEVKVQVTAGQITTVAPNKPPAPPRVATEAEKEKFEKTFTFKETRAEKPEPAPTPAPTGAEPAPAPTPVPTAAEPAPAPAPTPTPTAEAGTEVALTTPAPTTLTEEPPPSPEMLSATPTAVVQPQPVETTSQIIEQTTEQTITQQVTEEVATSTPPPSPPGPSFSINIGTLANYGFMKWNGTELVGHGPSIGSDIVTQIAGWMVGVNATSYGYNVTLSGAYNPTYNTGILLIPFISNAGSNSTANLLGLSPGASGLFNGAGYFGFIGGSNNGTDILWSLRGIYILNNGTIGKLSTSSSGPYHGSLYANGTWEGTGYTFQFDEHTLSLSPAELYPGSPYLKEETLFLRAGGAYNGTAYLKNYRFGNETWGILIGGSSGNFYNGTDSIRFGLINNEGPTYYLIKGSRVYSWGFGDFINATHIGDFYLNIFDNASSSSSSYTAVMIGDSYLSPLTFGSGVGVLDKKGFLRWNGTAFETLGPSVTINLANGTSFNSTTTQMTG